MPILFCRRTERRKKAFLNYLSFLIRRSEWSFKVVEKVWVEWLFVTERPNCEPARFSTPVETLDYIRTAGQLAPVRKDTILVKSKLCYGQFGSVIILNLSFKTNRNDHKSDLKLKDNIIKFEQEFRSTFFMNVKITHPFTPTIHMLSMSTNGLGSLNLGHCWRIMMISSTDHHGLPQ